MHESESRFLQQLVADLAVELQIDRPREPG
jgi:hypothetical protein